MGSVTDAASPGVAPAPARDERAGVWLVTAWAIAVLPLFALRALRLQHAWDAATYVPIHALAEIAIALVGFATFAVQWYAASARGVREARGRFIGGAFLGVAVVETIHLLVFPGMPGFLGHSTVERGIAYWLVARAWTVVALIAAAFIPPDSDHPLLRRGPLLAWNLAIAAAVVAIESSLPGSTGVFFEPGSGLTATKVTVELGIALLALAGAALHWNRFRMSGDRTLLRIAAALGVVVLSEICFTMYASAYDLHNLLGHAYALVAATLMFDALFVAALLDPYRRLDAATRELASSNARLDALRAHVAGELETTIARLEESSAREQLARAELEAAIAAVPDGIVVYGAGGEIVRMNAAAERLLRHGHEQREETLLQRWARLRIQTTDGKPFSIEENPVVRALRGESVPGVPASLEAADGRRVWVSISAAPTRAEDGRLDGAVAAFADIGTIQELQSQRDDLLRAVSHDLRNPLQIVLLQAERLQRLLAGSAHEKERLSAERIAHASKQMGVMIRDLVEAARMENGRLALAVQSVELGPFLERLLAQSAGALDVARVKVELPPDLPAANGDPARLERIFLNLVGNALKYSPETTEVRVTAAVHDGKLHVSVADRGIGIAPEDLPHVFARFYRGRRTQKSDGLGLGLYIVQLLVEAHGGRVWAESEPGEGSTLSFTLPAAG